MIKNQVILIFFTITFCVLVQTIYTHQKNTSIVQASINNTSTLISEEEIEKAVGFLDAFDEVIAQSATLEALLKKMAHCVVSLRKAKESCANTSEMQKSEKLKQAIDQLNVIYKQCATEIYTIAGDVYTIDEVQHMLLIKILSEK